MIVEKNVLINRPTPGFGPQVQGYVKHIPSGTRPNRSLIVYPLLVVPVSSTLQYKDRLGRVFTKESIQSNLSLTNTIVEVYSKDSQDQTVHCMINGVISLFITMRSDLKMTIVLPYTYVTNIFCSSGIDQNNSVRALYNPRQFGVRFSFPSFFLVVLYDI